MKRKLVTVDAETLLATPMSKTMFIVDGLIPQGVNVLSGAAKIGKSWLMLWLGLQVSQGFSVWGIPTMHCDVLYLCLEDTLKRIKDRLFDLTDDSTRSFHLAVTCGLIGNGLEEEIINFLEDFPKTKLVIIDTLQKVRDSKGSTGKTGMYGNDYDDISSIKRIADEHDISIILVHHLRKLKDGDDPFNEVSGSTGITGAADTNYVLKRKRSSRDATLLACGRDVEYQELTLRFQDLKWELVERKNTEEIHTQIFPEELHGQAGLRYGHQAVGAMAAQTGTGQGQPLIRTETCAEHDLRTMERTAPAGYNGLVGAGLSVNAKYKERR